MTQKEHKDNLARALVADDKIQVAALVATDMVNESIRCHQLSPVAAAALGRGLMSAVFLSLNLKNEETITLRVLGDGPLGGMITQGRANGKVRGYVARPDIELPLNEQGKLAVGQAVGANGHLYVTKDMELKEPYVSSSALVSGEVAEDLAHYFFQSEQLPVAVSLGVLIDVDGSCLAAGGYLIKALPGADPEKLAALDDWIHCLPPISTLTHQLNDPVEMLQALFPQETPQALSTQHWQWQCDCNRGRLEKLLVGLGTDELRDVLEKDHQAEMICHFCGSKYIFDERDLQKLIGESERRDKERQ